jgi:hypothetical protein
MFFSLDAKEGYLDMLDAEADILNADLGKQVGFITEEDKVNKCI